MGFSRMQVLGVMSGTSLDGLDLALTRIEKQEAGYSYEIIKATTIPYSKQWHERLLNARNLSGLDLMQLDADLGVYIGTQISVYFAEESIDLVSSHGHTVHHVPGQGFTNQIGSLAHVKAILDLPVVGDFRSMDVAKGGQGAPLVPIGDALLFGRYDYCLNLGGISNISFDENGIRKAYDIGPCNIVSNVLAGELGYPYDLDGGLGKSGDQCAKLNEKLKMWDFYQQKGRSLGIEQITSGFLPLFNGLKVPVEDKLHTYYHHIAEVISNHIAKGKVCLVTGGGAKNAYLIECLQDYVEGDIVVPNEELIDFKEAVIFAFLGYLRWHHQINVMSSVTGASSDSSSGVLL